jgi:hypothetical protein
LARFSKGAERMLGTVAKVQNARRTNETKVFYTLGALPVSGGRYHEPPPPQS